jgi:hypothetical protein
MYHSKKGMSAHQIHRMLGTGSYETAWYMCHRIRVAMKNSGKGMLFGEVEVDETFVGGFAKNRHVGDRFKGTGTGGIGSGKTPVVGAISRKGKVVTRVVQGVDAKTLKAFVRETVSAMGLTRFGGHPEAFARGAANAKNPPTVFAGVSPADGRSRPCWT